MAEKMTVATSSDVTPKAYNFLKEKPGEDFTLSEIAQALGVGTSSVTGGVVSLVKKEAILPGEGKEGTDPAGKEKTYKSYTINPAFDVEFTVKQKSDGRLSDKAIQILQWLQQNPDSELTHAELAEELGWATIAVVGAVTALNKKGFVDKPVVEIEMPDGKVKELKAIVLTEEGKAYKF